MKVGIDISHWQKLVDFKTLKEVDQVDFVILKAGGSDKGFYTDSTFKSRYSECKKYGIPVGAYYFVGSKCTNSIAGMLDAQRFISIIQGMQFEYPICLDFEAPGKEDPEGNTQSAIYFCRECEKAGYYVSIYASDISGFKERLNIGGLSSFDKWVARYGKEPEYVQKYGMWQFSSRGSLHGISGHVDCDYAYKDYPEIMRKYHLNGY